MRLRRVPESLVAARVPDGPLIVRMSVSERVARWLGSGADERVAWLECAELPSNCEALPDPAPDRPIPGIEFRLADPANQFPEIYQLSHLARRYPVRVSVPVAGADNAIRLAAALGIEISIRIGQPNAREIRFLEDALHVYLHGHDVAAPIEFFHSLVAAYANNEVTDLWDIQGENPRNVVDVLDDGTEALTGRLSHVRPPDIEAFRREFPSLQAAAMQCLTCPHITACRGFFKWPESSYDCTELRKAVLDPLQDAAFELAALVRPSALVANEPR
jgi:hypothetical protein